MISYFLQSRLAAADCAAAFILILFMLAAWRRPFAFHEPLASLERFGSAIAKHKKIAAITIALLPLFLRLCLCAVIPTPVPGIHDEFSYLLASDTFAHGRLTNPPHPMRIFFEAAHINQLPTYMSKYPPAQGAVLALGQVFGHPWIGVLLSVCLMCAAVHWMLKGWLPQRWAFLGALFVALRIGGFSYWVNSYWGGAVAAIGGALVMGALPRLLRSYRILDAVFLALGLSILANSRPFEGLVLCASVAFLLPILLRHNPRVSLRQFAFRLVSLPVILILLSTVLFMGYYNWRGTHDAFLFPYKVNDQAYGTLTFIWQHSPALLHSANPQIENLYDWERWYVAHNRTATAGQLVSHASVVALKFAYFFLWPQFILPFAFSAFLLRDTKIRFFLLHFLFCFLGMVIVVWSLPHYAAPLTATAFLLVTQALRHIRLWRPGGKPVGLALSRTIVFSAFAMTLVYTAVAVRNPTLSSFVAPVGVWATPGNQSRADILKQLQAVPGKHLVIVRYSPGWSGEWISNDADIDGAKVVWACEIPGVALKPLLNYFSSYRVWLLEPEFSPPHLTPFTEDGEPRPSP